MVERFRLVQAWEADVFSMTELSACFGVSRKTAYKWVSRYRERGLEGLVDQSRAPQRCPHRTPEGVVEMIVKMRRAHPNWGPKKILDHLSRAHPEVELPAVSTAGGVLKRAGLVAPRRRRRVAPQGIRPLSEANEANQVWTMDFKGEFRLGNRRLCFPLTIQDRFSRYVLTCHGLPSVAGSGVRAALERLFATHGLPAVIRTDNGVPFAGRGLHGVSRLNVWWLRLGIVHERIEKGHPEQNGAHERMHRDLKAETTRPPAYSLSRQQRLFDRFQHEYNTERPHEGIGQQRPAELWTPSTRSYPRRLSDPEYAGHCEVRRVHHGGQIKFHGRWVFLSEALVGELVALEPVDDGVWSILFNTTTLGRFDERTKKVYG